MSIKWNFKFRTVSIPRSLNQFSDAISKCFDYEDYGVTNEFYKYSCSIQKLESNFDRFANNYNAKTALFNSISFCVVTQGINSFNYNLGLGSKIGFSTPYINNESYKPP